MLEVSSFIHDLLIDIDISLCALFLLNVAKKKKAIDQIIAHCYLLLHQRAFTYLCIVLLVAVKRQTSNSHNQLDRNHDGNRRPILPSPQHNHLPPSNLRLHSLLPRSPIGRIPHPQMDTIPPLTRSQLRFKQSDKQSSVSIASEFQPGHEGIDRAAI